MLAAGGRDYSSAQTSAHAAAQGEETLVPMETEQEESGPPIGAHAGWEHVEREGERLPKSAISIITCSVASQFPSKHP